MKTKEKQIYIDQNKMSIADYEVNSLKHWSQTRWGLLDVAATIDFLDEQGSQYIFPQHRQWCLRCVRENVWLHFIHSWTSLSFNHRRWLILFV
jgi:hypothetical protein